MTILNYSRGSIITEINTFYLFLLGTIGLYHLTVFIKAFVEFKNLKLTFMSILAMWIQFYGYGYGYIRSSIYLKLSRKNPEEILPEFFFGEYAKT